MVPATQDNKCVGSMLGGYMRYEGRGSRTKEVGNEEKGWRRVNVTLS